MPLPYARRLDPTAGELLFTQKTNAWTVGDPDTEAVVRVLRTPLGSYLPDPTFGLDYGLIQARGTNAQANIERELARALARVVKQRGLRNLTITVSLSDEAALFLITCNTRSGRAATVRFSA